MVSAGEFGLGEVIGITLCGGDGLVSVLSCLGGEYKAMLVPKRRFWGCPMSSDSSDEDNSFSSP